MTDDKPDSTCIPFEDALEKTGNGTYNAALAITCAMTLLAIGADLFGFSLVVNAACDLDLSVTQKGILTSIPFLGILLVSYFWGYISDVKGRKFTLLLSLKVSFLLSCLSSLSPDWISLGVIKFVSVCFSCASNSATYTLVGESCISRVSNKYMLLMTCLLLTSPAAAAFLTYPTLMLDFAAPIPFLNIVFRPWRLLCIVLAIPLGIAGFATYFFYESPKFLINRGRYEETLQVLSGMYAINHRCQKSDFKVTSLLQPEEKATVVKRSLMKNMWEQSAPLFRPPLLWRTVQLFYIVAVVYITNNSFLVWLPHIMKQLMASLAETGAVSGNLCSLISLEANSTQNSEVQVCHGTVEEISLFTIIGTQAVFVFLNLLISYLQHHRRKVLILILLVSAFSGALTNAMPEPISSVIFFTIFTCTCLGMGILASYFVDQYPTSYRGMAACLSIMVGRSSTFVGINLVGILLFKHCYATFYLWSLLVLSSAVAAFFLPPDKQPASEVTKL